ncbi:hypothetical protein M413DRAFT_273956 [Hebeloma cylindrosporum]|uniref:Uncharacterized protein n=1 Tax=Hebeloma cylindrosporum TaxID=76867 RepID=A0A0C3BL03_HEBCY|nr:hypothetical protein M413DRAFT_273956 [Hebeloma cylindrosporum h7]
MHDRDSKYLHPTQIMRFDQGSKLVRSKLTFERLESGRNSYHRGMCRCAIMKLNLHSRHSGSMRYRHYRGASHCIFEILQGQVAGGLWLAYGLLQRRTPK